MFTHIYMNMYIFIYLRAHTVKDCTITGREETLCEKVKLGVHLVSISALQSSVKHPLSAEFYCRHLCVGSTLMSQRDSLISPSDTQETSILRETVSPETLQALGGFSP